MNATSESCHALRQPANALGAPQEPHWRP